MSSSTSSSTTATKSWKRALSAVVLMAAHNATPVHCFGTAAAFSGRTTSTTRFFRSSDESVSDYSTILGPTATRSSTSSAAASLSPVRLGPDAGISKMPVWLSVPKSHLVQTNMDALRSAMMESFFTENEASKLIIAIEQAANGDSDKLAGAADFCLILVETMEMGLNPLIAAAFHYCYCVSARERSLLPRHESASQFAPWDFRPNHGIEKFGEHAVQIELDAARLKRLEVVASMVIKNNGNSQRVTPDSADAENLRKLYLTESKDWRALAIRSAACLYRMRGILKSGTAEDLTPESVRTCREALYIYAPLASRLGMHRLKNELEGAAFQILYRRQFETVTSLLHNTLGAEPVRRGAFGHRRHEHQKISPTTDIGQSMQQILGHVQADMTQMLENDPVFSYSVKDFTVTARVKEPYSTWKKMLKSGSSHILQVPDAIALRIVLNSKTEDPNEHISVTHARERALCYYAQKLCTGRWEPVEGNARFKDYIEHPKANGYQSLHYTASTEWQGEDWSLEIQIRSGEMHKVAEFGLASHWDYKHRSSKMGDEVPPSTVSFRETSTSDGYLRSLQLWHWSQQGGAFQSQATEEPTSEAENAIRADRIRARTQRLAPYIEALTEAQSGLAREQVFVFMHEPEKSTSEGHVFALPSGAVVLDALREFGRENSVSSFFLEHAVAHNGMPAVLTSRLRNGDVLSIPTVSLTPSI